MCFLLISARVARESHRMHRYHHIFFLNLEPEITDFFGYLGAVETSCEQKIEISSQLKFIY